MMKQGSKHPISILSKIIIIVFLFLAAIVVVFTSVLVTSTKNKIESINTEFGLDQSVEDATIEKLHSNPAFLQLQKERSFLQARITMAESDSICLSVNLADSVASLEINGAAVFTTKMSQIKLSSVFRKADEFAVNTMLSSPFEVQEYFATIKKEPIMIKLAPKDTIEANSIPYVLPDTSSFEPVNFILVLNNGFKLYVYQEENEKPGDKKELFMFDLTDRFRYIKYAIKSMLDFQVPEYQPYIRILLPKDDAKIIYRALAKKGMVSVNI